MGALFRRFGDDHRQCLADMANGIGRQQGLRPDEHIAVAGAVNFMS
jgi:hypothetical protein